MPLKLRIGSKRIADEMWFVLVDNKEDQEGEWGAAAAFFRKALGKPTLVLPDEPWLLRIFADDMLYYGDPNAWDEDDSQSFRFKPFTRMGRKAKAHLEQLTGEKSAFLPSNIDLAGLRDALKK